MKERKVGHVVFGRYQLVRPLARGGMSALWVATDRKLKREVAVKLMSPTYAASERSRQRFELEAMSVAKLQSPHIVQIYDYGVDHLAPFIVMELLTGEDLRRRLKRERRLPLPAMTRILVQTALGLSEAHEVGMVHRDLKPGNVFLSRSRSGELVKILDFGVAKAMREGELRDEEITEQGAMVGTPQYMSPEQIRCLPEIDFRSDLFSLGVIVYRALTGELPFKGKTPADLGVNICSGAFPQPTHYAPELPRAVDDLMRVALAKDAYNRFASASAMAEAFVALAPAGMQSALMSPVSDAAPLSQPPPSMASWPASGPITVTGTSNPPSASQSDLSRGSMPSGSLSNPPNTPIPGVSQTGTSMSALLQQTIPPRPPSWKRRTTIGVAVIVLLGAAGAIGTMVGTTAANSDAGREAPAAPPRAGETARADEHEAIDEPPPETSATASASAPSSQPVQVPRPRRKTPAKDAPGKDDENWDPFQNRK